MNVEELNNLHKEERRLWHIHEQRVAEANVARDIWYIAYRAWIDAEESVTLNKKVREIIARERQWLNEQEKISAEEKLQRIESPMYEFPRSFDNG